MICKCGARVKASPDRPKNLSEVQAAAANLRVQVLGTIEGKGVTTALGKNRPSSGRSNSIRRSEALDRMTGKRTRTCSRWAWKPDAINATFFNPFGNERGS